MAEDEQEGTPDAAPGDAVTEPVEAAKKPARARKAPAKAEATEEGQEPAAKKPAAKKPAAKKPAAKKPAADKPDAKAEKPAKAKRAKKTPAQQQPAAEPVVEEAAPEPTRAAARPKPSGRRPVVRARARYVRTSARKARMVCGHIRGKSVQEARAILAFTPREVARDWSKLLESAVANAENNHELLEDDLVVREVYADEGPTIKRFRPRAMGRATPIRKRTSHLTITLTPRS
jgi:ribosomal protein L22